MIPLVRDGGLYASRKWTPLVMDGGYTQGGGEPEPAWEYKYVAGMSPLLLAAALGKPLKSLTQYGLCSQASTPAPSTPVDIYCNNGKLVAVDDELPAAYKRVLGFTLNNNSYWEIPNFPLYGSDTLRFSFYATDACNVIGAYSGSASGNNFSLYVSTSSNYLRYKSGAYNSAINLNTRYDVEITPTGSHGMKTDSTWTEQTFTTPTNLCIGITSTTASSAKLKGNLYGSIEVVGRAKFVPCERVSDNALGYYDIVGEAFYEQASGFDGAVSLGYDGSHYRLAVDGTPEVLWIDDGNKFPPNAVADVRYPVSGSGSCIVSCNVNNGSNVLAVEVHYYKADGTQINYYTLSSYDDTTHMMYKSFSLPNTAAYVSIERKSAYSTATVTELKLKMGSTVTPYVQPTGVASAENLFAVGDFADEQEIISGAVTRKCGVWVLTGEETWSTASTNTDVYYINQTYLPDDYGVVSRFTPVCSHLGGIISTQSITAMTANTIKTNNSSKIVYVCVGQTYTAAEWKKFLADQYAAGTPVIILYPLAEETTESVTPQPLSTAEGDNVVSVSAEVSPISLGVEYAVEVSE